MICEYFGKCGGCKLPLAYDDQLRTKLANFYQNFAGFDLPSAEIFKSNERFFRNRGEFRIYRGTDNRLFLAMNRSDKKAILPVESCQIACEWLAKNSERFLLFVASSSLLADRLFGLDYLTNSDESEVVIVLIYHKELDEEWLESAKRVAEHFGINLIGRSRKIKFTIGQDFVNEQISVPDRSFAYKHFEGSFTQPNGFVNHKMINWVYSHTAPQSHDLLELYCGNGNFTLPLSTKFGKTVAIELAKSSLKSAKENAQLNSMENITFVRMSAEEFVRAFVDGEEFNRLREVDLKSFDFGTIFVDPPRAGLDETSLSLAKKFENIIYISCNPDTLKRDLELLIREFEIVKLAIFDQFAYSLHLEAGVILKKRATKLAPL